MYLGLDLGTSGLRAVLADEAGTILESVEKGYAVANPSPGWSEQDPQLWLDACEQGLGELQRRVPERFRQIQGIGLSGHMHGATLLGADGQVLRPCILWNDTRSHVEAAKLDQTAGVRERTGNIVFPGFTAPKLLWVREHEPELFSRIHKVLLPKDYLRLWLTGDWVSECSDAAGTSWLDVQRREWSTDLLAAGEMEPSQMPGLVEGIEVTGTLRPVLARQWGLSPSVVVVGGGADNAASACGAGSLREGEGFLSLGTSGVILAARDSCSPMPETAVHTFCHAVPDRWYQMSVMLAATDSLNWLARNLGRSPKELTGALDKSLSGPQSALFLPYLSGERTPHNDSLIRGAFLNLDIAADSEQLTRAVLEGVSFGLRDGLEALRLTGTRPERLLGLGGGTRSEYWVKLLATVLQVPIDLPEQGDYGAARGAVRLAQIGAAQMPPEEVILPPRIAWTVEPDLKQTDDYEAAYQKFRQLYPVLRGKF